MKRTSTRQAAVGIGASVLALVAAGCGVHDRAGGASGDDVTVLTFAQPNGDPPTGGLAEWAKEVDRLSDGALRIDFKNGWRSAEADYEAGTIADVRAGKVDLAWVGARAFDQEGLTSFQALLAPLLVDSQDLQEEVFATEIPHKMLGGLDRLDLTGLTVLPGPMRKLLGIRGAFVEPEDFSGAVVGIQASREAASTFDALGARAKSVPSGAELTGLDAYEQQLGSIWRNHYELEGGSVTGNLNFWPRPLVVFAGHDVFAGLSPTEQNVLRKAGDKAMLASLSAARAEDEDAVNWLCGADMEFVTASSKDLAALNRALRPVYRDLRGDPDTKRWLGQITALKATVGAGPDTVVCAGSDGQPSGDASPKPKPNANARALEGDYQMTVSWPDTAPAGCMPGGEEGTADEVVYELTLADGQAQLYARVGGPSADREVAWAGTYRVFRDQIELRDTESATATYSLDAGKLTLSDMRGGDCGGESIWTTNPWVLTP